MTKLEKVVLISTSVALCLSLLIDATLWPITTLQGALTVIVLTFSVCVVAIAIIRDRYSMALLLLLIALVAWFLLIGINKWKENVFRKIVKEVQALSSIPHDTQAKGHIIIHGKVLVWDLEDNALSSAETHLPHQLRANFLDRRMTIFLILPGSRQVKVDTYNISGRSAYRQLVDVCAIYWPEKKIAGWDVISAEPPFSREVS